MWNGGDKPYEMWMNGEMPVGGLMDLPSPDVPPCWLAYVSTPDLDGTLEKVRSLGGAVHGEMAVPQVGRFAVIADPQGGVIAVIEPEGDSPGHDGPPALGEFSWRELATPTWKRHGPSTRRSSAGRKRAGWTWERWGSTRCSAGAHIRWGASSTAPPEMPAVGWLLYMRVPDAHAAAKTVTELGGRILNGPMEVPGGDLIAQCMDAQGVAFAVHSTAGAGDGEA